MQHLSKSAAAIHAGHKKYNADPIHFSKYAVLHTGVPNPIALQLLNSVPVLFAKKNFTRQADNRRHSQVDECMAERRIMYNGVLKKFGPDSESASSNKQRNDRCANKQEKTRRAICFRMAGRLRIKAVTATMPCHKKNAVTIQNKAERIACEKKSLAFEKEPVPIAMQMPKKTESKAVWQQYL